MLMSGTSKSNKSSNHVFLVLYTVFMLKMTCKIYLRDQLSLRSHSLYFAWMPVMYKNLIIVIVFCKFMFGFAGNWLEFRVFSHIPISIGCYWCGCSRIGCSRCRSSNQLYLPTHRRGLCPQNWQDWTGRKEGCCSHIFHAS